MGILIGADLVPTTSNAALFEKGDVAELVGEELLKVLNAANYRIFNLEVPLTDVLSPIEKCGPALIAATSAARGYKALGVDLLTLANNHILDQGVQGLASTCKALDDNGIAYVGVGDCLQSARQPYIFVQAGHKIGVYACVEHEFSIAEETTPGANPFDPLESLDHVAALKAQSDYVIVLYHGGKEHYRYPSPNLQKVCRKLVEKGADLVVCQHSHCIGCEEKYLNGTIVYGQGNFIFDDDESEFWKTSLLLQIEDDYVIRYIPLVKKGNTVRLADAKNAEQILNDFKLRSEQIQDPAFVESNYVQFARTMKTWYLTLLNGGHTSNIFMRAINKLTGYCWRNWLIAKKYNKKRTLIVKNIIECEAHRELLLKGLEEK